MGGDGLRSARAVGWRDETQISGWKMGFMEWSVESV
jgi:hypothetical protein